MPGSAQNQPDQAAGYAADIDRFGSEIYDGQMRLGRLYDDGCTVVAELACGADLGTFTNRAAAIDAIIRAARSQR